MLHCIISRREVYYKIIKHTVLICAFFFFPTKGKTVERNLQEANYVKPR